MRNSPNKKDLKTKIFCHSKKCECEKKCSHNKTTKRPKKGTKKTSQKNTKNRHYLTGALILISSYLLWLSGWRKTAIITACFGIIEFVFGLDFALGAPAYAVYSAFVIGIRILHRTTGLAIAYT